MFTGLVTDVGTILSASEGASRRRLRIATRYDMGPVAIGASIACGGPCLTVVDKGGNWFEVEVGAETLARTTAGAWRAGERLNLERSLRLGDEMGGHLVSGHVDGVARIAAREDFDGLAKFGIDAPPALARFIAEKGSVALDGVSLTVNGVSGARFDVLLIPHTLAHTTFGERAAGDGLNLEVDLMARYAARLSERME